MKKLLLLSFFMVGSIFPFSLPTVSLPQIWPFKSLPTTLKNAQQKPRIGVIKMTDSTDGDETTNRLYDAAKDSSINGILLVIDSSGGSAAEFSVIHDMVKKVVSYKPIVALVKSRALSGGYLAASATDYIIAHSYSEIGNIGVVLRVERFKNPKITDRVEADLSVEIFTDSEVKTILDPFEKDLSEVHRDYIKSRMTVYSNHFRNTVATNRHLDMEEVKNWSEGKVFIAHEALELKLIDQIGTIFDVDKQFITLLKKRNPKVYYANEVEFIF